MNEPIEEPVVENNYPTLIKRVQSNFIDVLLIIGMMIVIASVIGDSENTPDWVRIVLLFIVWGVYEPLSMQFGATLGNYLTGIRVRKSSDHHKRINLFEAYVRFVVKLALGSISFFSVHFNKKRRAIHDMASGSVVIEKQKD